ncbi:hypothetical protein CEXT_434121 [Caerostris extrusa]|uniref:Ycf15 n=1 Tax=Caerostris extrusa TaxID=172846 RepID=A0AAV4YAR0_CAEEX|nr:hypothetical protein CEXT_434121 [Caerostris extrusa]
MVTEFLWICQSNLEDRSQPRSFNNIITRHERQDEWPAERAVQRDIILPGIDWWGWACHVPPSSGAEFHENNSRWVRGQSPLVCEETRLEAAGHMLQRQQVFH